jgi:DNA-binding response OmpR family regulator
MSPFRSLAPLAGTSILIVEDEPLVALDIHATLSAAGASIISATTSSEAVDLIGYAEVSAAVVDLQLGANDAAEVCEALARRHIPFVFYTGHPQRNTVMERWPHIAVLRKPAAAQELIEILASALRTNDAESVKN